ncbi:formylglycine-generating enzyme family protein [Flagellimonas allohymeniacidonis]|uniref:Formylglycine-generating enzyme family protein n=1 Tax=Flagellimonas allohymeniacidonis TaxID=2517819 RepID=A0A4Q8QEX3_9FLAO|nr:formylglycine-generating enzyme family protein [Allomuricauda hymeniacidonis]TAI48374.1 formylglycine-generating enzyme family protein [Allomuricauda hymeniacidonis]
MRSRRNSFNQAKTFLWRKVPTFFFWLWLSLTLTQCIEKNKKSERNPDISQSVENDFDVLIEKPKDNKTPEGMVWIPGGSFTMGAVAFDSLAMSHEKPNHTVWIDGFFMDSTEVTNAQFGKFVQETGYVTVAEREIDWENMKDQLPADTPKPPDSILQPGSLIFGKPQQAVQNLSDYTQWWQWKIGANWKHPLGPGSDLTGKESHPVVHIAYEDAVAYCKWSGTRLPTEAEWEYAARGGTKDSRFPWGNEKKDLSRLANTWTGTFPSENDAKDGYLNKAPVASYPANNYGLYDMVGNVWEWTQDWYNTSYYKKIAATEGKIINPKGANKAYNAYNSYAEEKVIKGGSFLCNENYCASYRVSARMANTSDSAQEHLGFRTVKSIGKD